MIPKKIIFYILIINLVFFFLSQYAPGQIIGSKAEQQEKEETPELTYEVVVRVTKIDVIVTDKTGKRITGLKPENFEIYEDGTPQGLTNFYEVKGMEVYASVADKESGKLAAPEEPLPPSAPQIKNKVIIYFDNWHLHPMNRNWSIKKIKAFIQNNFPPGSNNEGMVVCLDQKFEILQNFTSNQEQLISAVTEVKERSGQSLLRRRQREELKKELNKMVTDITGFNSESSHDTYVLAVGQARNYVEAEQADLNFSLKSLSAFIDHLTGLEGRKILIYVSDGLPLNPADEVFNFLDQAFPTSNARVEAMNYDATRMFKELTAKCNANEITLYTINAQGLESMVLSADKQEGWNTLKRGSGMVKAGTRTQGEALKLMASDTGGLAILNTNDIETGLDRIKNDLQFYYTLGYKSPYRDDNKYHSIEVKLVGIKEKYDVRVRQGYKQSPEEERIKEGVFSGLFFSRQQNPIGIMVQVLPVEPKPLSNKLCLTLKLFIPIKNLALNPHKDEFIGQIKVYVVLKDSEGRISPCRELSEEIKIPEKDFEIALKRFYPYLVEMYVDPGHYTISLAVRDVPGATTTYLQTEKFISSQ
jgi:VWFA-related protein